MVSSPGYEPNRISYYLSIEGDGIPPDTIDFEVWVGDLEGTRVESFAEAFEAGFQAMSSELMKIDGVGAVKLSKTLTGMVPETEVFKLGD